MSLFYTEVTIFIITCILGIAANLRMRKIFFYLQKHQPLELKKYRLDKTDTFQRYVNPSVKLRLYKLFWRYICTDNFPDDERLKKEIKILRNLTITALILFVSLWIIPFIVAAL